MDFVIHKLLKDVNGPVTEKYRASLIRPTKDEISFVNDVTLLFLRHRSGRIYGNFEPDTKEFPLSRLLEECQSSEDFLTFSVEAAKLLVSKMKVITAATGGFFFVSRFEEASEVLLLIFMLNQQVGRAVDEATLSLRRSVNLQMEHLDLAARINITQWQLKRPEPISLIRGRKEVSDYFKSFIGIHEPRTNTQATQELKRITDEWMEKHKYEKDQREAVREHVVDYAKNRGAKPVELDVIATLVDQDRYEEFFEEANQAKLGAEFHVDRTSLKGWERVVYSEPDIRINFAKKLLLTKRVNYNPDKKTLLIKQIELPPNALL